MIYGDTSLLVAALTPEPMTTAAQSWLAANTVAVSGWTHVEFCNAVALKQRMGKLTRDAVSEVLRVWDQARRSLTDLPIAPTHYDQAAALISRSTTGLRSGDALHAAIAAGHGHVLATRDERLLRACAELAIPAINPLIE